MADNLSGVSAASSSSSKTVVSGSSPASSPVVTSFAGSGSLIDAHPPALPWEPRAADAPPLAGPSLADVLAAPGLLARAQALVEFYNYSRLGRALERYSTKRGHLLAGGISFVSLFSITAALTIGWTMFMAFLGDNQLLRQSTLQAIDRALPGLLVLPGKPPGLLHPDTLLISSPLNLASLVAIISLVLSASRVMNALKTSLWSMFGIVHLPDNPVVAQVRDYTGFLLLTFGVLLTATLGIFSNVMSTQAIEFFQLSGAFSAFLLQFSSLLVAFLVDALVFAVLVRRVAGIHVPAQDLFYGCVMLGVLSGVVRFLGTRAVGSVNDPFLAAGAAVITLLLWVNLLARLVLMIAAWMANPPYAGYAKSKAHVHADAWPNYVTMSEVSTLNWPRHTLTGDVDRDPRHDPDEFETVLSSAVWESRRGRRLRSKIASLEFKIDRLRRQLWSLGERRPQK